MLGHSIASDRRRRQKEHQNYSSNSGHGHTPGTDFGILSRMIRWFTLLSFLCGSLLFGAEDDIDGFTARIYRSASGEAMPYRLFIPPGYNNQKAYPLVLWLHGSGGAGTDNIAQISDDQILGTHIWTEPQTRAKYPAFVLAPQNPVSWVDHPDQLTGKMRLVLGMLDSLKAEFNIDATRIYVAGQSDGGFGTWNLITQRPDLFAAAIPLCGGGEPRLAGRIARMPLWVFHGRRDDVVSVRESRNMISAIRKAGGHPKYTEYPGVGHDVWKLGLNESELIPWLFAQHR
jgi:predicted peptidase